jgi:peptidoglycan/LPS O-acetylase OafA/YrhL
VALFLIVFHFAVPFLLLLNRPLKRRRHTLAVVAGAMLLISVVDVYWLVVPAFFPQAPRVKPTDLTVLVSLGGFWLWAFAGQLRGKPLVPMGDARLEVVSEHGH